MSFSCFLKTSFDWTSSAINRSKFLCFLRIMGAPDKTLNFSRLVFPPLAAKAAIAPKCTELVSLSAKIKFSKNLSVFSWLFKYKKAARHGKKFPGSFLICLLTRDICWRAATSDNPAFNSFFFIDEESIGPFASRRFMISICHTPLFIII